MYQPQHDPFYPNMAVIKKYFNNKLLLAKGILHIVSIAISLVAAVLLTVTTLRLITPELLETISETASGDFPSIKFQTNLTPNITSYISPALMAFTSLFIYFKSKNDNPGSNPSVGFLIKYIMAVVGMIGAIIGTAIMAIGFVIVVVISAALAVSESYVQEGMLLIGIMIALSVMMATLLVHMIFQFRYIKSIRLGFKQPKLENKGAKVYGVTAVLYMAVMICSLAVCGVLLYFLTASQEGLIDKIHEYLNFSALLPYGIVELVSLGVSFAIAIINAKLAFGYHKYVEEINSGALAPEIPEVEYVDPAAVCPASQPYDEPVAYDEPVPDSEPVPAEEAGQPDENGDAPKNEPAEHFSLYCTRCGNKLTEDSLFCSRCGNKVK